MLFCRVTILVEGCLSWDVDDFSDMHAGAMHLRLRHIGNKLVHSTWLCPLLNWRLM